MTNPTIVLTGRKKPCCSVSLSVYHCVCVCVCQHIGNLRPLSSFRNQAAVNNSSLLLLSLLAVVCGVCVWECVCIVCLCVCSVYVCVCCSCVFLHSVFFVQGPRIDNIYHANVPLEEQRQAHPFIQKSGFLHMNFIYSHIFIH